MNSTLRARTAVAASFAVSGVSLASFLSRVPGVRDGLGLSSAQLGLLLLCLSGGSMVGLPVSGPIVHRFGPARAVLAASMTVATGSSRWPPGCRPAWRVRRRWVLCSSGSESASGTSR